MPVFSSLNAVRRGRLTARDAVRAYGTPDRAEEVSDQLIRAYRYELLFQVAQGVAYDDLTLWADYRSKFGLYRNTRHLWNHAAALLDFYAYRVWSGTIPDDGMNLPDGVENMVPFAPDTEAILAAAAAALLLDWSFQDRASIFVRNTAILGEQLLELKDYPESGRISLETIWPAFVKEIDLNEAGDVQSFVLEYKVTEKISKPGGGVQEVSYVYRRESDRTSFRTYRNGQPFAYPDGRGGKVPPTVPNPYGFVPAVWMRHHKTTGIRGESALVGTLAAADEVNSLLSHLMDKTHVALRSPVVVSGNFALNALQRAIGSLQSMAKRGPTNDYGDGNDFREEQDILEAPAGTRVETIDVNLAQAREVVTDLKAGVEKNIPETTVFEEMRTMTQITGPAAARLFGDVEPKYRTIASGSYDRSLVKLIQMGISMSGWRVNNGDWDGTRTVDDVGKPIAGLTERQERFRSFNLGSYGQGKMNLVIMPRQLFPATLEERLTQAETKRRVLPSLPETVVAEELGYDPTDFEGWVADAEAKAVADQQRQLEMAIASRPPQQSAQKEGSAS